MEHKALVDELIRGRNTALKLLEETKKSPEIPPDSSFGMLVEEVLASFSHAISAIGVEPGSSPLKVEVTTSCCSEGNSKKRKAQSGPKRNGHSRRSISNGYRTLLKTTEDGYTWRKYGQKEIYGSKFPRSYFRCTHKYDRECPALRQVQQSVEDPSMYEVAYFGEHTCMQPHASADSPGGHKSASCIIDFSAKKAAGEVTCDAVHRLETPIPSTSAAAAPALPQPKQECDEEVLSSLTPGTSTSDLLSVSDFPEFEEGSFQYDVSSSSLDLYPLDEFAIYFNRGL